MRRLSSLITILCLLVPSFAHAAGGYLYVTQFGLYDVAVVSTASNSVVDTIDVGGTSDGVVVSGTGVYVARMGSNFVSVIDSSTNTVERIITVGGYPRGITLSGTGVYVANSGSGSISIIDTTTQSVERTISTNGGARAIALSGTGIYVANEAADTVSVIDTTTFTIDREISVGDGPRAIGVSGTGVFVGNGTSDNVSVIDTTTLTVDRTITVGDGPEGVGVSGTGVYIANNNSANISLIDRTSLAVEATITVGSSPYGIVFNDTEAYVTNYSGESVSIINTATNVVDGTISVDGAPFGIAFLEDTETLAPTITAPLSGASVSLCDDLTVSYTLPEVPTSGSVEIFFYNTTTHTGPTLTMNNSTGPSFSLDLENLTSSANVVSAAGGTSLVTGSYVMYLSYQDAFGNTAEDDTANLTVTDCPASSSSSSSSSSQGGGGSGGGRPITPEYILEVSQQRFGSSSSSSSASSRSPLSIGGQRYDDVWTDTWFATFVRKIIELRIFEGYKTIDGTPLNKFGPADPITLGQLAKVGTILWDKKDIEPKPKGDAWFAPYISKVQALELAVFNGKPNPLAHATRAQVVQTVIEALGIPVKEGTSSFTDVPANHPNIGAIITAANLGFIKGDEGTNLFRPDELINRAEVAKILSLALGNVGINYLDDMLDAEPTVSASSAISSTASASSSAGTETLKSAAGKDIRRVTTAILNVRSDARIDSTLLWVARKGQEFEVLRIVGDDWAHVRVSDGGEGYVWVHHLSE